MPCMEMRDHWKASGRPMLPYDASAVARIASHGPISVAAWITAVGAVILPTGGCTCTHVAFIDTREKGNDLNTPPRNCSCESGDSPVVDGQNTRPDHGLYGSTAAPGPRNTSSCLADLYEHHAVYPCVPVALDASTPATLDISASHGPAADLEAPMLASRSLAKVTASLAPEVSNTADATIGAGARPANRASPLDVAYTAYWVSGLDSVTLAARSAPAPSDTVFPACKVTPAAGTITSTVGDYHAHIAIMLGSVIPGIPGSPNTWEIVSTVITGIPPEMPREQRNPPARTAPTS